MYKLINNWSELPEDFASAAVFWDRDCQDVTPRRICLYEANNQFLENTTPNILVVADHRQGKIRTAIWDSKTGKWSKYRNRITAPVDITIDSEEYWISEPDGSRWDAGESGIRINGINVNKSRSDNADYQVPMGITSYALVEHWSDGGTFGSSEFAECKGVYQTHEEAVRFQKSFNTNHGYFGKHLDWLIFPFDI